jgi:hypothetical protein
VIVLPFVPSIGRYRFTTVIDDVQYTFKVRWNSLDAAWYFDVLDFDGTPIVEGIKIVLGVYLARHSSHPLFTKGVMLARSLAQPHRDPGFDDLGIRVEMRYFNRGDLVAEMLGSVSEAT